MAGNRTEKNPIWSTMMVLPEVSRDGMKNLSHTKQGQNEPYDPVLGSGRSQSEISLKQKEGYGQHSLIFLA